MERRLKAHPWSPPTLIDINQQGVCVLQCRQVTEKSRALSKGTDIAEGTWLGTAKHNSHSSYKQSTSQQSAQTHHLRKRHASIHTTHMDTQDNNNQIHCDNALAIPPQITTDPLHVSSAVDWSSPEGSNHQHSPAQSNRPPSV
jgi:hypothetical protein